MAGQTGAVTIEADQVTYFDLYTHTYVLIHGDNKSTNTGDEAVAGKK